MTLMLVAFVVAIGFFHQCAAQQECHMSKFEACLQKMTDHLHTYEKRTLPDSPDQLNNFCKVGDDTFDCIDKFQSSCMSSVQRELAGLLCEGVKNGHQQMCTEGTSLRTNYLTHVSCLNQVLQGPETQGSFEYMFATLEKMSSTPMKDRLIMMCCGYRKAYHSLFQFTTNTCGPEATEAGEELVALTSAQLPNLLCQGFNENSEICKDFLLPDGSKPSGSAEDDPVYKFFYEVFKNHMD